MVQKDKLEILAFALIWALREKHVKTIYMYILRVYIEVIIGLF